MSRFLLSAAPFTGHVAPIVAIAAELVRRGHEVRVCTGSRFRARVEAAGARLIPWRAAPDFDENDLSATFPRLVGRKGFRQLLINMVDCFIATAPAQVADLAAEWEREPWDAMACDETSLGAVLFARTRRMPWTTIGVLPLNLAGTQGPPSGLGLSPGTNPASRTRDAVLRRAVPLLSWPLRAPIAAAERAVGLTPSRLTFERIVFSSSLIIASGSPGLDYARTDRPAHLHFVGEIAPASSGPLPRWWGDLQGRRVILVTQGTQNIDPDDLIRPALAALADRDAIVVVTSGIRGVDTLPFPVPANARVADFVPFGALLPRLELAVTNGGWGGTVAALARGIPLVIGGGDLDKPEVAARVAWSGAGVNLRTGTPSAADIAAAADRMLADGSFRAAAERLGAELRALGGAARAAELLERTAQPEVASR